MVLERKLILSILLILVLSMSACLAESSQVINIPEKDQGPQVTPMPSPSFLENRSSRLDRIRQTLCNFESRLSNALARIYSGGGLVKEETGEKCGVEPC